MATYLAHHGIKGQKWGVRRFQNEDGTLTDVGKKRYNSPTDRLNNLKTKYTDSDGRLNEDAKQKLRKAAAIAGGVALAGGLAYAAYRNPAKAKEIISRGARSVNDTLRKMGKQTVETTKNTIKKSVNASTDTALTAIGAIAITKIDEFIPENTGDSRKDSINKIAKQSAKESIRSSINTVKNSSRQAINGIGNASYSQQSSRGGNSGQSTSNQIGSPSGKAVDKNSDAYRNLLASASPETKSVLKAMASQGYDIKQLEKYASLHHSAIYYEV